MNDAQYPYLLKELAPEFEAKRGAKVNLDILGFAVYNQPADLELSTKGSSWDFVNVTSIYTGRWIGPSRLPRPLNIQKIPFAHPIQGGDPGTTSGDPRRTRVPSCPPPHPESISMGSTFLPPRFLTRSRKSKGRIKAWHSRALTGPASSSALPPFAYPKANLAERPPF